MKNIRGFTLIELLICIVFICVIAAIVFGGVYSGSGDTPGSFGLNGYTEVRCIEGYKFVIGEGGQARQIMDASGAGVTCN